MIREEQRELPSSHPTAGATAAEQRGAHDCLRGDTETASVKNLTSLCYCIFKPRGSNSESDCHRVHRDTPQRRARCLSEQEALSAMLMMGL